MRADHMLTYVEFRSAHFPPYENEEQQINLGRFGKRLAEFLGDKLRLEGFQAQEPVAEDWGWWVPVEDQVFRLWIGCGNYPKHPNGFLCFIEPHTPFIRKRLRKIDVQQQVTSLQKAIDRVLSVESGVREKRWWTHEEFTNTK